MKKKSLITAALKISVLPVAVLYILSCKQLLPPNADIPNLINDTGVNITVTFDPNGGEWGDGTSDKIKKIGNSGNPLPAPGTPQKDGVIFTGWNRAGGKPPALFPAQTSEYKAMYRSLAADEAFYEVKHLQENTAGTGYAVYETEKKIGKKGSTPVYSVKSFEGFEFTPPVIPQTIAGDGSTKVELRYKRKQITLTFNLKGGTTPSLTGGIGTLNGKYGTELQVAPPEKAGFDFVGWNTEGGTLPSKFPATDTTYTAIWKGCNLIKNADFSQTEAPSGGYTQYWKTQRPKEWTEKGKKNITGVEFKAENGTFSVKAGTETFAGTGGISQTVMLPDVTDGTTYTLTLEMKIDKKTGSEGGGLVRIAAQPVLKKYSGTHSLKCGIKVTKKSEKNFISFKNDSGAPVEQELTGTGKNKFSLELFSNGIKNVELGFSDIALRIKETE